MNTPEPNTKPEGLQSLVADASLAIDTKEALAAELLAKPIHRAAWSGYAAAALALCFAGVLWLQVPRLIEPYASPDPEQSSLVAEADLEVIAQLIWAFQISQSRLPSSLDEIQNIPDTVKNPGPDIKIAYKPIASSYVLTWTSPYWSVQRDGVTGKSVAVRRGN